MRGQTKNKITRAEVEKELSFLNRADIRSTIATVLGLAPLLVFLTFCLIWLMQSVLHPENRILIVLPCVFSAVFLNFPLLLLIFKLAGHLKERKMLLRSEFEITTRAVQYKSEKMIGRHMEEFLHFPDFKEISANRTVYQLTSEGDEFYLVHYRNKTSVKLIFPLKMYEYEA